MQKFFDVLTEFWHFPLISGLMIAFPQRDVHIDVTSPIPVSCMHQGGA